MFANGRDSRAPRLPPPEFDGLQAASSTDPDFIAPLSPASAPPPIPPLAPTQPTDGQDWALAPQPDVTASQGAATLPVDAIGDIPPPPVPQTIGSGVAGGRGTEAGTLALPGTRGAAPFRSAAFQQPHRERFGPGVPMAGGGDQGLGLSPDDAAELLRQLALGSGQQ